MIVPTDDYFPRVREVCDRHDVLFIADEVITGFCRTGKWFALEHWNVQPDIMSFAKGVTSGYLPLGGIMVSKAIKQAMDEVKPEDRWMHAYTYSGHPTCCAVGLANIDIMERERLWERAAEMGKRLHDGLKPAFGDHARRRHPRRQGPAGRGRAGGGPGDQGQLRRRQEVRAARVAGDEQARRRHARARGTLFFAPPLVVTKQRSIGSCRRRATPSRR